VNVVDTTGAGDAFCAGVAIGLTYGKDLKGACDIGAHLAASVIDNGKCLSQIYAP
jgi:pseudouridine kinase